MREGHAAGVTCSIRWGNSCRLVAIGALGYSTIVARGWQDGAMGNNKVHPVRVANEQEFRKLLDHLAIEASRALDHWRLFKELRRAIKAYAPEVTESQTFWFLTLRGHADDVLFRLSRLYDQQEQALGLKKFLVTVKNNISFFSEDAIRQRLGSNPYANNLVRKLNLQTLGNDLRYVCADRDSTVRRLWKLRNESVFHVAPNPIRLGDVAKLPWLKDVEIDRLLNRACRILNRYSVVFRAVWFSGQIVGHKDYRRLLDLVRLGLQFEATQRLQ